MSFLVLERCFASPEVTGRRTREVCLVAASPSTTRNGGEGTLLSAGNQQHGVGGPGEIHPTQTDRHRSVWRGVVSDLSCSWGCMKCVCLCVRARAGLCC